MDEYPSSHIHLVDVPYTSDLWQPNVFRQEIGLPEELLPSAWRTADPFPEGDFQQSPLRPGQLERVRWSEDGEIVSATAFRIGLPKSVREVLLEYCNKIGITEILRHVTVEGNGLNLLEHAAIE